ncbi:MAG: FG-GAP-like repeat-containing protein [Bacteroidota bacterium]|nr:FG-GAP-like repeat-containing protein [Bacteroidota bacterium]
MKTQVKLFVILFITICITSSSNAQFTEVFVGGLTGVDMGSVAWGDYDNDGDLDILLTGHNTSSPVSKIYQNTGSGFTEVFTGSLIEVCRSSVAWGDYDNDGDLDILLTGTTYGSGPVSKIYQNTGTAFTEVFAGSLTGTYLSSATWGDYDNDGDLDILLTGTTYGSNRLAKVYQNTGSTGFIEVFAGNLTGVYYSSTAWGDYDIDGDLDILLTGYTGTGSSGISKIYQNTGDGFTEVYAGSLTGVCEGSVALGDYDNDGDLDILLTGQNGEPPPPPPLLNSTTQDVLLTEATDGNDRVSKIYQNTGSGFTEMFAGSLTGVYRSSVAWGDYDNDGDLDILLCGITPSGPVLKIYQNDGITFNTVPNAPTGLSDSVLGNTITLIWNKATDTETPQNGLTYNLRIGTEDNGINNLSPMADVSNGYRRVVCFGNTNHDTAWTIKNLSIGTYYWSVQAIDNAFAGSPFATEATFNIITALPTVTTTTATNVTVSSATVNGIANPNNSNTTVLFVYGKNPGNYTDSITAAQSPVTGTSATAVSADLSDLLPGQMYYYRVVASNVNGYVRGDEMGFSTIYNFLSLMAEGWNMLSVPLKVTDYRKTVIYLTGISNAFTYNGSYVISETLNNGVGYWVKFSGEQNVEIIGYPIEEDTIDVIFGWNMIGSITYPVYTGLIQKIPHDITTSMYFGYDGAYEIVDMIDAGKSYWVRTNKAGKLVLKKAGIFKKNTNISGSMKFLKQLNSLVISDSQGRMQTLYFGNIEKIDVQIQEYELPPLPPAYSFDARFASGRFLEIAVENKTKDIPILISTQSYPVTIKWKCSFNSQSALLIIGGEELIIEGEGKYEIRNSQSEIKLRFSPVTQSQLPKEFALDQNYPNPFNPSTIFRYQLPEISQVTLRIYNILGHQVKTVVDEIQEAGYKEVRFDAATLPSGLYFYRLTAGSFVENKKMLVIK